MCFKLQQNCRSSVHEGDALNCSTGASTQPEDSSAALMVHVRAVQKICAAGLAHTGPVTARSRAAALIMQRNQAVANVLAASLPHAEFDAAQHAAVAKHVQDSHSLNLKMVDALRHPDPDHNEAASASSLQPGAVGGADQAAMRSEPTAASNSGAGACEESVDESADDLLREVHAACIRQWADCKDATVRDSVADLLMSRAHDLKSLSADELAAKLLEAKAGACSLRQMVSERERERKRKRGAAAAEESEVDMVEGESGDEDDEDCRELPVRENFVSWEIEWPSRSEPGRWCRQLVRVAQVEMGDEADTGFDKVAFQERCCRA